MIDIYIATPYNDPDPAVCRARFEAVTRYAAHLVKSGLTVYSPITHSHPMAEALPSLGLGWTHWQRHDMAYIPMCAAIHVLMLPGWKESTGVQAEIVIFKEAGKPVLYVNPVYVAATEMEVDCVGCETEEACPGETCEARVSRNRFGKKCFQTDEEGLKK